MTGREIRVRREDALIRLVRIYPEGALLTRRWSAKDIGSGPLTLVFPTAEDVDAESVSARAVLQSQDQELELSVGPVQSFEDAHDEGRRWTKPSFEHESTDLLTGRDRIELRQQKARLLEQQERLIQEFVRQTWTQPNPPLDTWRALLERFFDAHASMEEEAAREEGAEVSAPFRAPVSFQVTVPDASAGSTLRVELTFPTGLARWRPAYDLRAAPAPDAARAEELEVVLLALVEQNTQEDWTNISLHFDASAPLDRPLPPALHRLAVSGFQGPPISKPIGGEENSIRARTDSALVDATSTEVPIPWGQRRVPGPVSLRSDPLPGRIEILSRKVSCESHLELRTEGPAAVWRVASGSSPCDLPAAPASILRNGVYVGRAQFPEVREGEAFRIELGAEPALSVIRSHRRDPPRRSRGTNRLEHHFETVLEVSNSGQQAADIEVRGRLPLVRSVDVELETHSLPAGTVVDPGSGFTRALVRLPPGGQRALIHSFSVHAPRSVVVSDPGSE